MIWRLLVLALVGSAALFGCASQQTASDSVVSCAAPLSSVCDGGLFAGEFGFDAACPPEFASELPGPWCASNRAGAVLGSCGGYVVLPVGYGVDVEALYLYPADGGALAAVILAPNGNPSGCMGGSPDFALPSSCLDTGDETTMYFDGPGALPGCSTFDAGEDAATDGGQDASLDAADGGDA
ncbi:MAG: hypothetical protein ACLQVI_07910 [Polyangiaceae bacterium]